MRALNGPRVTCRWVRGKFKCGGGVVNRFVRVRNQNRIVTRTRRGIGGANRPRLRSMQNSVLLRRNLPSPHTHSFLHFLFKVHEFKKEYTISRFVYITFPTVMCFHVLLSNDRFFALTFWHYILKIIIRAHSHF